MARRSNPASAGPRNLVAVGLALALTACTAEGTHSPTVALTGEATQTKTLATTLPTEAQAYNATATSKVEASTEALVSAAPAPSSAAPKPRSEGFDLFKAIADNNKRAGKIRPPRPAANAARVAKVEPETTVKVASRAQPAALPGVRSSEALFGIKEVTKRAARKAKTLSKPVQVASAAALARIGRHGLRTQHSKVSVGCLKPELVRIIKKAERHFGRYAVVTSGYRSPRHNRRIGGAKRSMHMTCMAADIQIKGVSKWTLAKWLRQQDGRGGVGTYCHTQSVHIDVGEKRDWNRRCRRSRKRRKA